MKCVASNKKTEDAVLNSLVHNVIIIFAYLLRKDFDMTKEDIQAWSSLVNGYFSMLKLPFISIKHFNVQDNFRLYYSFENKTKIDGTSLRYIYSIIDILVYSLFDSCSRFTKADAKKLLTEFDTKIPVLYRRNEIENIEKWLNKQDLFFKFKY